jgi:hypothetical protein
MLERYVENFDEGVWMNEFMRSEHISSVSQAKAVLRERIRGKAYFINNVTRKLKKQYPGCYIRNFKLTEADATLPDVEMIYKGHVFAFVVLRPLIGMATGKQTAAIKQIKASGGSAGTIHWPEEAVMVIEKWEAKHPR